MIGGTFDPRQFWCDIRYLRLDVEPQITLAVLGNLQLINFKDSKPTTPTNFTISLYFILIQRLYHALSKTMSHEP
jgi:hypothetical protein